MNPETRNLVAAISLSMAVLIGYQLFFVMLKKIRYQQEILLKMLVIVQIYQFHLMIIVEY